MKKTTVNTNQKTEKKRKLIITAAIVIALFLLAIFSTLAYLTSTTNTLDNVMTAGNITATLDETETTPYGVAVTPAKRIPTNPTPKSVPTGNNYTLIPGHQYTKDPQIHVAAGSESCYVYMIVYDQLIETNSSVYGSNQSPEAQMIGTGDKQWTLLTGVGLPSGQTGKVYAYNSKINKHATDPQTAEGFKNFTLSSTLTNDQITALDGKHIIVNGAAIQSDGFESKGTVPANAKDAWLAVYGEEAWKPLMVEGVKYYPVFADDAAPTGVTFATKNGENYETISNPTMSTLANSAKAGTLYYKGGTVQAVRSVNEISYNNTWVAPTTDPQVKNFHSDTLQTGLGSISEKITSGEKVEKIVMEPSGAPSQIPTINGVNLTTIWTTYNGEKLSTGFGGCFGFFWSCVAGSSNIAYDWDCGDGGYWDYNYRGDSSLDCVLVSRAFS